MENLQFYLKVTKNRPLAFTKVLTRQIRSPIRTSLANTLNAGFRSLSRTHKKSPLRGKISPKRFTPVEKISKQDFSVSTTTSIMSRGNEEEPNIIKTPTTINEEPNFCLSLDEDLRDYFNRNPWKKSQVFQRPNQRYKHSVELVPMRSETPEIPTKLSPKSSNLPVLPKKVVKKTVLRNNSPLFRRVTNRSPSPYQQRSNSRTRKIASKANYV